MNLRCSFSGHEAGARATYNAGFHFGACRHCGADLIRTGRSGWRPVPRGHAVVWKDGRHSHSMSPDFDGHLPVALPSPNLPAVPDGFISWSRDLAAISLPRRTRAAAQAAEDAADAPLPALVVIALLVGAGVQWMLGLGSRRTHAQNGWTL